MSSDASATKNGYGQNPITQIQSALSGSSSGMTVTLRTSYAFCNTGSSTTTSVSFSGMKSASAVVSKISSLITTIKNNENNYTYDLVYVSSYQGYSSRQACNDDWSYYYRLYSSYKGQLTTAQNNLATAQTNRDNKQAEITALTNQINGYTQVQSGKTESEQARLKRLTDEAKAAYDEAAVDGSEANENLNSLLNEFRSSIDRYQNITLIDDIYAQVPLGTYYGTINGAGHTINVGESVKNIFSDFRGTLANVAVNGEITGIDAKIQNVAYWNGKDKGFYYNEAGVKTFYDDLGKLSFNVREQFGADFAKGILTPLDTINRDQKVYDLTLYNGAGLKVNGYFQFTSDGKLIDAKGKKISIPSNRFIYSVTSDVGDITVPNVFYSTNGNDYMSNNVEIDLNGDEFYCPENIDAKSVTIKGDVTTNKGRAGLCLPFALKHEYFSEGTLLCILYLDSGREFSFTRESSDIAANTPVLIVSKESKVIMDLTKSDMINITKTPDDLIVRGDWDHSGMSRTYGTFKAVTAGEIGELEADECTVYALKSGNFTAAKQGNFTEMDSEDVAGFNNVAKFKPFRMVIVSKKTSSDTTGDAGAPRYVSIVDEFGNELSNTSGIDFVDESTNSFGVTGGEGEIIITSESDRGMVEVYDLTGRLVAAADVKAGETKIRVRTGVYIVAGSKVMVK